MSADKVRVEVPKLTISREDLDGVIASGVDLIAWVLGYDKAFLDQHGAKEIVERHRQALAKLRALKDSR